MCQSFFTPSKKRNKGSFRSSIQSLHNSVHNPVQYVTIFTCGVLDAADFPIPLTVGWGAVPGEGVFADGDRDGGDDILGRDVALLHERVLAVFDLQHSVSKSNGMGKDPFVDAAESASFPLPGTSKREGGEKTQPF